MAIRQAMVVFVLLLACTLNAQVNAPVQKPEFISDTIPTNFVPAAPFSEKDVVGIWYEPNSMLGDHVYHVICRDSAGGLWYRIFRVVKGRRIEQAQQNLLKFVPEKKLFEYTDYIEPAFTGTISLSSDSVLLELITGKQARRVEYIGHVEQELWRGNKYYPVKVEGGWRFEEFTMYMYTVNGVTYRKLFRKDKYSQIRRYEEDEIIERSVSPEGLIIWRISGTEYTESKDGKMLTTPLYTSLMKGWRETLKPLK